MLQPINIQYYINDNLLIHETNITESDVVIYLKLTFVPDIENRIAKILKMLGFVIRNYKAFTTIFAVTTLYNIRVFFSHMESHLCCA